MNRSCPNGLLEWKKHGDHFYFFMLHIILLRHFFIRHCCVCRVCIPAAYESISVIHAAVVA